MAVNANYPTSGSSKVGNLWNSDHALADEGSYFVVTNPTPGTVITTTTSVVDDAATASATHAQFSPWFNIQNGWGNAGSNAKSTYLKYLRIMLVQVPTSATTWRFAVRTSTLARVITGTQHTPVNVNGGSSVASPSVVYTGVVTQNLDASNHLVANGTVGSVIPVTLDQWTFTFGDVSMPTNFLNGAAAAKNVTIPCAPIACGPGGCISFEMWGASNAAAPTFEYELGFVERQSGL